MAQAKHAPYAAHEMVRAAESPLFLRPPWPDVVPPWPDVTSPPPSLDSHDALQLAPRAIDEHLRCTRQGAADPRLDAGARGALALRRRRRHRLRRRQGPHPPHAPNNNHVTLRRRRRHRLRRRQGRHPYLLLVPLSRLPCTLHVPLSNTRFSLYNHMPFVADDSTVYVADKAGAPPTARPQRPRPPPPPRILPGAAAPEISRSPSID
jgi:hypothetical protein